MAQLPITENPAFSPTLEQITVQDRGEPGTFNPRYQVLLDNDNHLKKVTDRAAHITFVTIPAAGWSATAPYTHTVAVEDLTAEDNPMLVRILPDGATPETVKAYNKAFGMIDDGDTAEGTAVFKCYNKKPAIDLIVGLKGV